MKAAHPALVAAAEAASSAYTRSRAEHSRAELAELVADGADGTPTMRIDVLVEGAIVTAVEAQGCNVLSEECGWIDRGSSQTLVIDPVDGSANAAAGVPLACFSAALAVDAEFVEAMTVWLDTGRTWWARRGGHRERRTTGTNKVSAAAVSLLRPHERNREAWWRVAERAARIRVLSCSTLDAALVADGSIDAFADAGSDTHRLVDLAAALVLVEEAGGVVVDAYARPIELDTDLRRRWSGVMAATPTLGDELCSLITGDSLDPTPEHRTSTVLSPG